LNQSEWLFEGRRYLVNIQGLATPQYSLLVFSPIDQLADVRFLEYGIGVLSAVFGILIAQFVGRRAEGRARQRHNAARIAALNDKLVALNKDKDRYLGIAAHDLRNPLSSMRGLSELMLETPLEPEQSREFLETIRGTSDEMLSLVNDLLDTSVIESGKLVVSRTEQDIAKLVRRRIRHLEPHARNKQIHLEVTPCDGTAAIDAARFAQVIDNLVSNAIKFSPPGSTVRIDAHCEGDRLRFSVEDQGPGISPDDRDLLFRSFQKLSARPTAGEKSTGLGLAIVKKIVDAHRGSIEVDNAPGGGARFMVSVPRTA
jgi:signal transduction histidine kinase